MTAAAPPPQRSSVRWLDVLARVSRRLTLAPGVEELSRIAVDELARVFSLVGVSWWEPVAGAEQIRLVAASGSLRGEIAARPTWPLGRGLITRCVRTRRTIVVNDVAADPGYVPTLTATRSELCVPILDGAGEVVGLVDVQSARVDEFTPTAVEALEAIAAQAAIARDAARLVRHQERRLREQEAVHGAALDILAARPYTETLGGIVDRVMRLCDADEGGIYIVEPDRAHLRLEYATGSSAAGIGSRLPIGAGMAGRIVERRAPMVVADYSSWEGRAAAFDGIPWRAVAGVPMIHGGEVIGVLDVMSLDPAREFDADDVRLLEHFAVSAALAISNARRAEEHVADLVAASSVARELSGVTDAAAARAAVCSTAVAVLGCRVAIFWEPDRSGGIVATASAGIEIADGLEQAAFTDSPSMRALRTGRPVFVPTGDTLEPRSLVERSGCSAAYAQPVVRDGSPAGVLVVAWVHREDAPNDRETALISLLAHDAAIAIERADLVARLDHLARRDGLTGAANRRAWEEELPQLLFAAAAQRRPISVAMLDLDYFKTFNDVQGHQRGDLLLREVATAWASQLREGDLLARYGGEEFALALPGCEAGDALAIVDRLRRSTPAGQTSSAGLAEWDGMEPAESLVARADAGLYEAKQAGRNRTAIAGDLAAGHPRARSAWTRWTGMVDDLLIGGIVAADLEPIVRLAGWLAGGGRGAVVGHAGMPRVEGPLGEHPIEGLVAVAQHRGLGRDLDWNCRRAVVAAAAAAAPGEFLLLGVGIGSLLDPMDDVEELVDLLAGAGRDPGSVVLAITEREAVRDMGRFVDAVAAYRGAGFRFAVCDVGEGHSTLEVLAAATPELIAVARGLCVEPSAGARAAVLGVVAFAEATEAEVLAGGLSSPAEAAAVLDLGITLGCGPAVR